VESLVTEVSCQFSFMFVFSSKKNRNSVVQTKGCQALAVLAMDNKENQIVITGAGGIRVFMEAMAAHVGDAGVQETALIFLATVLDNLDADAEDTYSCDGCAIDIYGARWNCQDCENYDLCQECHLQFLVSGEHHFEGHTFVNVAEEEEKDQEIAMAGMGGIRVVTEAMTAHAGHVGVQGQGCNMLRILAANPHNKRVMAGAACIRVVMVAMTAHAGDVGVQMMGCDALGALAEIADNKRSIVIAGGIGLVLTAMRAHVGHVMMQESGCSLLADFAHADEAYADNQMTIVAIARAGGIPVVLAAMIAHVGCAGLQEEGCYALGNLAFDADNTTIIVDAGGICVVLAAMTAHAGHADLQAYGCYALRTLAGRWGISKSIKDEGGLAVVAAAMTDMDATVECKEHGQWLVGQLAWV